MESTKRRWPVVVAVISAACVILGVLGSLIGGPEDTPGAQVTAALQTAIREEVEMRLTERGQEGTSGPTPGATRWMVTLDGEDTNAGLVIQEINLWKDYNDRAKGIAGKGRHGEEVELVRRAGDGVLVRTGSGVEGWVTYYFIRELK